MSRTPLLNLSRFLRTERPIVSDVITSRFLIPSIGRTGNCFHSRFLFSAQKAAHSVSYRLVSLLLGVLGSDAPFLKWNWTPTSVRVTFSTFAISLRVFSVIPRKWRVASPFLFPSTDLEDFAPLLNFCFMSSADPGEAV